MSDVKSEFVRLTLDGREYEIALTLGVIDVLQDKYGSLSDALDASAESEGFRFVLAAMLNDYIEYHNAEKGTDWKTVTEAWVGRHVTLRNLGEVNAAVMRAFLLSAPKGDGDQGPNAQAG